MTVRFWSGPPPRTEMRLSKSFAAATPAIVWRVRNTLSATPAWARTASGFTGSGAGPVEVSPLARTSTVSEKRASASSTWRSSIGPAPTVTVTVSLRNPSAAMLIVQVPGANTSRKRPSGPVTTSWPLTTRSAPSTGSSIPATRTRPATETRASPVVDCRAVSAMPEAANTVAANSTLSSIFPMIKANALQFHRWAPAGLPMDLASRLPGRGRVRLSVGATVSGSESRRVLGSAVPSSRIVRRQPAQMNRQVCRTGVLRSSAEALTTLAWAALRSSTRRHAALRMPRHPLRNPLDLPAAGRSRWRSGLSTRFLSWL